MLASSLDVLLVTVSVNTDLVEDDRITVPVAINLALFPSIRCYHFDPGYKISLALDSHTTHAPQAY